MITIEEFDAAYQRYYNDNLKEVVVSRTDLTYPLKQFEDTMKLREEGDHRYTDPDFFMMFVMTGGLDDDYIPRLEVMKIIVSVGGNTGLPLWLKSYHENP